SVRSDLRLEIVEFVHAPATFRACYLFVEDADDADLPALSIVAVYVLSNVGILDYQVVAAILPGPIARCVKQWRRFQISAAHDDLFCQDRDLARGCPIGKLVPGIDLVRQVQLPDNDSSSNCLATAFLNEDFPGSRVRDYIDAVALGYRSVGHQRR